MKVSVAVITYNQEKTLPQTLDSILMQKGPFELEVVVGEDCSTDGTRKIVLEYQQQHPQIIKPLLQEKNCGIMKNSADTFRACTGDYINMIAGDDYWIDENKLAKQVAFLESHPDYGMVATDGYRLLVKKNKLVDGLPPVQPIEDGNVFPRFADAFGVYAMPLTVLYRADLIRSVDFDEFLKRGFSVEDTPLQAILSHQAKFGYIPDKTSVYRVYKESATFTSFDSPKYLSYHKGLVAVRKYLSELFPGEVRYSEEWAKEYIFYREFLQLVHFRNHKDAKRLLERYSDELHDFPKYNLSCKMMKNRIRFTAFRTHKERAYSKANRESL